MGLFSLFRKSSPPDYETVLSRLSSDISDAKIHLSEIRLRERRSSLLINLYGLGLWALWVGLWWIGGLPFGLLGWDKEGWEVKAVGSAGLGVGPLFIWGLNRLLGFYFNRQRNAEELHLRKLLTEQRKQVDAIKKATNYDSTRKLIEQYDENSTPSPSPQRQIPGQRSSNPVTPIRQGDNGSVQVSPAQPAQRSGKGGGGGQAGTPRAPGHLAGVSGTPAGPHTPAGVMQIPEGMTPDQAAALHFQMQAIQPVLPTPEKRWYDRVVDSILGDDPSQAPQSKYALVCGECFRHNGLVGGKYEWERMQWICPRCNHMNPPPLSKIHPSQAAPSTPTPTTPSQKRTRPEADNHLQSGPAQAPRPRRNISDRGTPRVSKLQEVFSAGDESGDGDGDQMEVDKMDVDEQK